MRREAPVDRSTADPRPTAYPNSTTLAPRTTSFRALLLVFSLLAIGGDAAPQGGPFIVDVQVTASADDAEQQSNGAVRLNSSDLELVVDGSRDQIVGVRFDSVNIPQAASIAAASVQFQVDQADSGPVALVIEGEAADNAAPFTTSQNNLSLRTRTGASTSWSPPPWSAVGAAGPDQRTPDIAAIVQEIVNRPGWSAGNAIVILFSGSGERTAEAYDGSPAGAPRLHVEYDVLGNTPPTAQDDQVTTSQGTPVTIDVTANDLDPNGNLDPGSGNTACVGCSTPSNGSLVNQGDGRFTYTPVGGFTGADSFVYEVCDTELLCDTAVVRIDVGAAVLEVRVATGTDDAEERSNGGVSVNSSDLEIVEDASGPQVVGLRFAGLAIPRGAGIGQAYLQFQVDETDTVPTNLVIEGQAADAAPTFSTSAGNISLRSRTTAAIPWAPPPWTVVGEAGPDQRSPDISPVVQEIVDRDGWSSGNALVIIISGSGQRTAEAWDGVAAAAPLLHVEYASVANAPPIAEDDGATTLEDTPVTIDVAANDTDPDGNLDVTSANTTCSTCASPSNGSLVNGGDGTFTYTPSTNASGIDTFVYQICDTLGRCDTATVTIDVTPVNDPPTALNDNATTPQNTAVTITVAGNDFDPDGNLDVTTTNTACPTCTTPQQGSLVNHGDGRFTYTPNPGFSGGDTFLYEICDALGLCSTASVGIDVTAVNGAPMALDDSTTTPEDSAAIIDVAANDSDPDGNLDVSTAHTTCPGCATTASGALVANGDGTFTYTPNANTNGADAFVYEICDTLGLCDTAAVTIDVTPVPDAPTAMDDTAATPADTPVTIDVAANDTDPDGDLDAASANTICPACGTPSNGTLVNHGDGRFTYTPTPGFDGQDAFVYEICDAAILCDRATVRVTVTAGNPIVVEEVSVASSSDDAEERASGSVSLTSSDLELVFDGTNQTVGLRFTGVNVPRSAGIASAYVQFQTDETGSDATSLIIEGEAIDDAPTFTADSGNVFSRARTSAAVSWSPPPWTAGGEASAAQRTPDLSAIVQEIVNRPGWSPGRALALIISGSGKRTAESFDGVALAAPRLHVEYVSQSGNTPPSVDAGTDQIVQLSDGAALTGTVGDDGQPNPPGVLTIAWSAISGPGAVTFDDAGATETMAHFSDAGTYVLRLTAFDGQFTTFDDVTILVRLSLTTIRVPADVPTIQEAIDVSVDGDTVLVAPGTYNELVRFNGKNITLASEFHTTGDPAYVAQTVINGPAQDVGRLIDVDSAVTNAKIIGFTIQNAEDGILLNGRVDILNNHLRQHRDAIEYRGGSGGTARFNVIENNLDDAFDLNEQVDVVIEDNIIRNNLGDGLEIRIDAYTGPRLTIVLRRNLIEGNAKDGVQIIAQFPAGTVQSDRLFVIERNTIVNNGQAAIGLLDNADSGEDYRAASLLEPMHVFNNTIVGHSHGISGGDNMVVVNNLFVDVVDIALKNVDGNSIAAYNGFWNNGADGFGSNVDVPSSLFANPLLDIDYRLMTGSPAIDAGTAQFLWQGTLVLDIPATGYDGAAPDLGRFEFLQVP